MEASPSGEAGDRRPSALLRGRALSHSSDMAQKVVEDHLAVHTLIRAYQVPHPRHPHYLQIKMLILYFKIFCSMSFQHQHMLSFRPVLYAPNYCFKKNIKKEINFECQKSCLHSSSWY